MADEQDERTAEAKRRLRAALDGIDLLPEETSDDRALRGSAQAERQRDAEMEANKPPHH